MPSVTEVQRSLRVLCLEDEPRDAEMIRELLVDGGYVVSMELVASEADFVAALQARAPDIILSDYSLPGFDGPAALRCARRLRPMVPFICVSGTIGEDAAVELLKQGATDYVLKDRTTRLVAAIRRALVAAQAAQERRELESAMRAREEQLRFVTDHAPVGIAHCDRERRYKFVNQPYAAIFGRRVDEIVGRPVWEVLGEAAYADARPHMEEALAGRVVEYVLNLSAPNGGEQTVNVQYVPERDADGAVVGFLSAITDITERQRGAEALRRSQDLFRAVTENTSDAIYVKDARSRYLMFNSGAARIVGKSSAEVLGRDDTALFPPDEAREVMAGDRRVMAGGPGADLRGKRHRRGWRASHLPFHQGSGVRRAGQRHWPVRHRP